MNTTRRVSIALMGVWAVLVADCRAPTMAGVFAKESELAVHKEKT